MNNEFAQHSEPQEEMPQAPLQRPMPYPRRMYGPDRAEKTVNNLTEERALGPEWGRRRPPAPEVPSQADQASEIEALKMRIANLEAAFAKLMAADKKK